MELLTVRPVNAAMWPMVTDLFGPGGASNGCWCQYWILGPSYGRRSRTLNEEQLESDVMSGPPPGLLALDPSGTAHGWCRLTPREQLHWLNRRQVLAAVDDRPVWSLPCFYVRRASRGQGVTAALIRGAIDYARLRGARALEAYPVDTEVRGATRNLFPGTVKMFRRNGFTVAVRRAADRPIMRYDLVD